MSEHVIEKGIPIPPAHRGKNVCATIRQLEIGDSFLTSVKYDSVRSLATRMAAENGAKYVTRKEGEGTRIWRVS